MTEKTKRISKNVTRNLLHLCEFTVDGKIPIDISAGDRHFMCHILDKHTPREDVEVALVEDFRLQATLREAIGIIEGSNNDGRTSKTTKTR